MKAKVGLLKTLLFHNKMVVSPACFYIVFLDSRKNDLKYVTTSTCNKRTKTNKTRYETQCIIIYWQVHLAITDRDE